MMKKWMLGSLGTAAVVALAAQSGGASSSAPALQPMTVNNLTGTLQVQQGAPCSNTLTKSTSVSGGQLALSPAGGFDVSGGKQFTLASGSVSFTPFSMSGSCDGFGQTSHFQEINVQLSRAVTFTASDAGGGLFNVLIPAANLVVLEATVIDGSFESGYKAPIQDVTGTIDLTTGVVTMHVVLGTSVHFQGGCTPIGCIVDETDGGTVTVDLSGSIAFPDSDGDGVPDNIDNCRFVSNPDQSPVTTPRLLPPPNITVNSCLNHQIGTATATDICDGGPVSLSNNAPAQFPIGGSNVIWTAEDQKSRIVTASQIVTVVDTTPPAFTFVPPSFTKNTCGAFNIGQAIATDDCAGTPTVTNNAPSYFYVGVTPVTWTAKDVSGNTTTASQTVTVVDTTPPTISCVSDGPPGGTYLVTGADACGAPTLRLGSYVIANGERIKINETGQSGVTLIGTSDGVRHFHVGKGQAIVTATDGSNNVTSVACK